MPRFYSIVLSITLIALAGPAFAQDEGLSITEAYHLALKQSETVAIQQEVIKEAEGRFLQAFSGLLPEVSYVVSEERREEPSTSSGRRRIPVRKFTFSQPLFTGFKEFAAIAASRAEKQQRQYELQRAKELLFTDVADAFYFYLSYQDDIETLTTVHDALTERLKELNERQELGRSRASEVASAQARLSRSEADLEEVKGQGEIYRQLLEFLTGHRIDKLKDGAEPIELSMIENYLAKADQRSDVQAAREAAQLAKSGIGVARANFFPSVSADGNYYEHQVGPAANNDWDVTFTVDVPLFQGGENIGLYKEAKSVAAQEDLRYAQLKRTADLQVKNAYTSAHVMIRQEEALQRAYKAADENYAFQREDYRKNLVNNLEVLQALEDLQDMRRAWTSAKNETKRLYWNLLVTSGELHDTLGFSD